jgi:hypothetical protein
MASGRERQRDLAEETPMTTQTLSPVALSPIGRRALPRERRRHSIFAVAALGVAVLVAVAIAMALAMPNLPDIATIYVTVT